MWENKEILVTGGTGSLGSVLVRKILDEHPEVKGVRVYSRDEAKQVEMRKKVQDRPVSFLIGDVRDRRRLLRAMEGCHYVVHTAALKHVPVAEENPLEYIKTNVDGTVNVIDCCLDCKVERAVFISTDKAVYPVNLYGATKMCAERVWMRANVYSGGRQPFFSACRYGNVLGSRGSVVNLFEEQAKKHQAFTITDRNMTRFWITLEQAANFVLHTLINMTGGEIFVPRLPSMRVVDLATVIWNKFLNERYAVGELMSTIAEPEIQEIGIRPGEKLHECLITYEESLSASKYMNKYVIFGNHNYFHIPSVPFMLTSENNEWQLTLPELEKLLYGKEA